MISHCTLGTSAKYAAWLPSAQTAKLYFERSWSWSKLMLSFIGALDWLSIALPERLLLLLLIKKLVRKIVQFKWRAISYVSYIENCTRLKPLSRTLVFFEFLVHLNQDCLVLDWRDKTKKTPPPLAKYIRLALMQAF